MRIATLQIASKLGDVEANIKRADQLLRNAGIRAPGGGTVVGVEEARFDILVLPELALTGYNFPSLEAIKPYLEPAGQGPSASWARETAKRLRCKVSVGYPEIEVETDHNELRKETYYNSLLVVDEEGNVLLNYRKTFLYYTDETWASEGRAELGFHQLTFPQTKSGSLRARAEGEAAILPPPPPPSGDSGKVGNEIATSFGICMDINPYRFEAPYTAYEFAHRVLDSKSQLVILSMAWLTLLSREELDTLAGQPELDTFNYWIQRFMPLLRKQMAHSVNADDNGTAADSAEKKIILVFANRAGEEDGTPSVARYAGTSTIVAVSQRQHPNPNIPGSGTGNSSSDDEQQMPLDVKILCWDMLGAAEEGVCFADTGADPKMVFQLVKAA
ncbi:carbon-nitrogen hydrolase, partial [Aspergillus aurantiobrunneus]